MKFTDFTNVFLENGNFVKEQFNIFNVLWITLRIELLLFRSDVQILFVAAFKSFILHCTQLYLSLTYLTILTQIPPSPPVAYCYKLYLFHNNKDNFIVAISIFRKYVTERALVNKFSEISFPRIFSSDESPEKVY